MATPESPDQYSLSDLDMLAELDEQLSAEAYRSLRVRLRDLGMDKAQQQLFTVSAGDTHLRVFARPQRIGDSDSREERVVQRIIVNRLQSERDGSPSMVVDDYVIDLAREAIAYERSVITTETTNSGPRWLVAATMAPILWESGSDEVALHMGSQYESEYLPQNDLRTRDANAIYSLLASLESVSPGWRDDFITVKSYMYK